MERAVLAVARMGAGGTKAMELGEEGPVAGAMGEAARVASVGRVGRGVDSVDGAYWAETVRLGAAATGELAAETWGGGVVREVRTGG